MVWQNLAEFEQGQNGCCHHRMTGKQRELLLYSTSTIMRSPSLCFVLITTCNILYFVFELIICLLYHLQLHTRACVVSQWLHVQYSSSTVDAMFACM